MYMYMHAVVGDIERTGGDHAGACAAGWHVASAISQRSSVINSTRWPNRQSSNSFLRTLSGSRMSSRVLLSQRTASLLADF